MLMMIIMMCVSRSLFPPLFFDTLHAGRDYYNNNDHYGDDEIPVDLSQIIIHLSSAAAVAFLICAYAATEELFTFRLVKETSSDISHC